MKYFIYDVTGRIESVYSGKFPNVQISGGLAFLDASTIEGDDTTHYVTGGVITERPENTATIDKTEIDADGVDSVTISNIPNNSEATIKGPDYLNTFTVNDNQIIFTTEVIGEYSIEIDSFPEKNVRFDFAAN